MIFRAPLLLLVSLALLCLAGCAGVDLGDNPGPDVPKQRGPLTALPSHLKDGGSE